MTSKTKTKFEAKLNVWGIRGSVKKEPMIFDPIDDCGALIFRQRRDASSACESGEKPVKLELVVREL